MIMELENISKSFSDTAALKGVSFRLDENELLTLIGPSGSGKTTLLRILAGIETADEGFLHYAAKKAGKNVLVFQDFLLFPHLNVFDNISFGLRAARIHKNEIKKRVDKFLRIFHLEDKYSSFPNQLSGGQKQRVAIARAMILEPDLLLLDEPFANLDKQLKTETAKFIRSIQKELGTTTICVTHDLEEAFLLSDRIGILIEGRLHQLDTPDKVYYEPSSFESASLMGPVNSLSKKIADKLGIRSAPEEDKIFLRPEFISLSPLAKGDSLSGVISEKEFKGIIVHYIIKLGDGTTILTASMENNLEPGDKVSVSLSSRYLNRKTFSNIEREVI